jgi:hypothetical protein
MHSIRIHAGLLAVVVAATTMFLGNGGGGGLHAAIVSPGGSVTTDPATDTIIPTGDLVDEDVRAVTFQYVAPDGFGFVDVDQTTVDLTFRSRIYRDPVTQVLSFVYQWEGLPNSFGREGTNLAVSSFAGFSTDVTAELGGLEGTINRTGDGVLITAFSAGEGLGSLPSLLVITDATEFDQNGTVHGSVSDEFNVFDLAAPEDQTVRLATATLDLTGTFQPIADDGGGGGGGGGGTPIPLPAGVWGGMALLAGGGIAHRRLTRRRYA